MSADFGHLSREIEEMDNAGVDVFHLDIMDGAFVPNFALGLQDIQIVRKATNKLVDVHLMINNPGAYIDLFVSAGADIIYFHPEADNHPARVVGAIQQKGKKAGIALNPGTSVASVLELLRIADYVLVMTVNPGFPGQSYLPFVEEKIDALLELKKECGFEIVIDGAVDKEKVWHFNAKGVLGFVLGTKSMYGQGGTYKDVVERIRAGR